MEQVVASVQVCGGTGGRRGARGRVTGGQQWQQRLPRGGLPPASPAVHGTQRGCRTTHRARHDSSASYACARRWRPVF